MRSWHFTWIVYRIRCFVEWTETSLIENFNVLCVFFLLYNVMKGRSFQYHLVIWFLLFYANLYDNDLFRNIIKIYSCNPRFLKVYTGNIWNKSWNIRWILWGNSSCHAPLSKIRGNKIATRVGDVYTRGKYPTHIR